MDRIAEAVASRIGHRAHSQGASKRNNGLITSTGVPALDEISEFPVRRGHLVEVVGASSSGKTQILHTVAAKSLTELGNGHSVKVCWFDLNGGFDEQRLRKIITEKGNLNGNGTNRSGTSDLLRRFSVYYPKTTAAMCASLQQLPDFVRTPEGAAGSCLPIQKVM